MNYEEEVKRLNRILDRLDNEKCNSCGKHYDESDLRVCDHRVIYRSYNINTPIRVQIHTSITN
jgi:hypothetical protein